MKTTMTTKDFKNTLDLMNSIKILYTSVLFFNIKLYATKHCSPSNSIKTDDLKNLGLCCTNKTFILLLIILHFF